MRRQFGLALLTASLACASAPASAYTTLFAFGDSLSDAGNVYIGSGFTIPGAALRTTVTSAMGRPGSRTFP